MNLPKRVAHRALEDALTTSDLLHVLLEKAASLGVLGLDDLLELPKIHRHPQAVKLSLTTDLPRKPGVYQFLNARREVLYIGKATNLRSRVRSYFSSDRRKKVTQLLKETKFIEFTVCEVPLKAEVLEVQLIHRHQPRFNRQAANWNKYVYLKFSLSPYHREKILFSLHLLGYLVPKPFDRCYPNLHIKSLHCFQEILAVLDPR